MLPSGVGLRILLYGVQELVELANMPVVEFPFLCEKLRRQVTSTATKGNLHVPTQVFMFVFMLVCM